MNAQTTLHIYIRVFRFLWNHFVTLLAIYSLTVHEIYYEIKFLKIFQSFSKATLSYWKEGNTTILRQGFCLSEKDCYKYW